MPLAVPSKLLSKQITEVNKTPRYMDLGERLADMEESIRIGDNEPNKYLPSKLMDKYLDENSHVLQQFNAAKSVSACDLLAMQLLVRANEGDILLDLTQRVAKNRVTAANDKLKQLHGATDGVLSIVSNFIKARTGASGKANIEDLKEYLKSVKAKNIPTNKPLLVQRVFEILKDRNLIPTSAPPNIGIVPLVSSSEQMLVEYGNGGSDDNTLVVPRTVEEAEVDSRMAEAISELQDVLVEEGNRERAEEYHISTEASEMIDGLETMELPPRWSRVDECIVGSVVMGRYDAGVGITESIEGFTGKCLKEPSKRDGYTIKWDLKFGGGTIEGVLRRNFYVQGF